MLCVTVAGKRKRIKTPIELDKLGDFNPECRGENWIRTNVVYAKALNAQLADIIARAKDSYKESDKDGEVSSSKVTKEMNTEYVSPSFLAFARERAQMIYDNGGWRNRREYCGRIRTIKTATLSSYSKPLKSSVTITARM